MNDVKKSIFLYAFILTCTKVRDASGTTKTIIESGDGDFGVIRKGDHVKKSSGSFTIYVDGGRKASVKTPNWIDRIKGAGN